MNVDLKLKVLDDAMQIPSYAHPGDAGLDLRSTIDCVLQPGQRCAIPTGVAVEIPDGYAGLMLPRSGLAAKHGISIVNAPGLIDSGYRGELQAILINLSSKEFVIARGDRICQLVISPIPVVTLIVTDSLDDSVRGQGGLGSTGSR